MYLVYESLYGQLLDECDSTNIIGLYRTKEAAMEKVNQMIQSEINEGNYVLDRDRNDIERDGYVRYFWKDQENWDCYYELFIEKMEVK